MYADMMTICIQIIPMIWHNNNRGHIYEHIRRFVNLWFVICTAPQIENDSDWVYPVVSFCFVEFSAVILNDTARQMIESFWMNSCRFMNAFDREKWIVLKSVRNGMGYMWYLMTLHREYGQIGNELWFDFVFLNVAFVTLIIRFFVGWDEAFECRPEE